MTNPPPVEHGNISGQCGFIHVDPSDLADIGRWEFNREATVPEFCHSGSNGYNLTALGKARGDVSFDAILNIYDSIYDIIAEGQLVTLLLYENNVRHWIVPVRIKTIGETVEINQATEISIRVTAVTHGQWTYPDGSLAAGCVSGGTEQP
jgi:hypothetical protein